MFITHECLYRLISFENCDIFVVVIVVVIVTCKLMGKYVIFDSAMCSLFEQVKENIYFSGTKCNSLKRTNKRVNKVFVIS